MRLTRLDSVIPSLSFLKLKHLRYNIVSNRFLASLGMTKNPFDLDCKIAFSVLLFFSCAGSSFGQGDSIWKKILKEKTFSIITDHTKIPRKILEYTTLEPIERKKMQMQCYTKKFTSFIDTLEFHWAANADQYWILCITSLHSQTQYWFVLDDPKLCTIRYSKKYFEFEKFRNNFLCGKLKASTVKPY